MSPLCGTLHNATTNIWVYFFINKSFQSENVKKMAKKTFVTKSDTRFLTGDAVWTVPNRDIQWCDIGTDIRFTC